MTKNKYFHEVQVQYNQWDIHDLCSMCIMQSLQHRHEYIDTDMDKITKSGSIIYRKPNCIISSVFCYSNKI